MIRDKFLFIYYYYHKLMVFVALAFLVDIWLIKFPFGMIYRVIVGRYFGKFYAIEYIVTILAVILLVLHFLFQESKMNKNEVRNLSRKLNKVMKDEGFETNKE